MAQIFTLTGDYDKAIDELETHLSMEGWSTPASLGSDPLFAPLHEIPRFKKLMAKYAYMNTGS